MNKNKIYRAISVVVLIALMMLFAALSGCGSKEAEARTFTINDATSFDNFLLVIMREAKILDKYLPENVTVEWTHLLTGAEQRDALVNGSIDIGAPAVSVLTTALQNDMPLVFLTYSGANLYQLYARDEAIQSIADLDETKKISVSSIGAGPHTAFLLAAANDIGDASVFSESMIPMTNSDAITALISGTVGVDAAVCTFPTMTAAWNSEEVHLVRDLRDEIIANGVGCAFCASQEFVDKNPDLAEAFINACNDAVDMLKNDKDSCVDIFLNQYKDCTEEQAVDMVSYFAETFEVGMSKYDDLTAFLYEQGFLEEPAEPFENIPKFEAGK